MELNQLFKCNVCGNIVELVNLGGGTLVCCQKPMEELVAKTTDEGTEKHLPVLEETESGVLVKVGSVPHPMDEDHYIVWIEIVTTDSKVYRHYLKPTHPPQTRFVLSSKNVKLVRSYCNVHGLWQLSVNG